MKLKLVILSIFIIIYSLFFYINTQSKNDRIQLELNRQIEGLEIHYALTMDYFIQDVKSIRNNISNNKKAIALFSKAQNATKEQKDILRDKLYKLLTPMYRRIHSRGILQWQFVFPNNISFLRMHKPSKYGDDLTNIRYSFKHANKTKKTVAGFEQGRTTHAFRYVFPYYDKQGNHLGAVEISLASVALQEKFLNVNKLHSHFLVNKNIFSVKAWETNDLITKYIQSIEHKDYMFAVTHHYDKDKMEYAKNNIISPLRDKITYNIPLKKSFALYTQHKDTMKVITFLPIKNTQEEEVVAYIVSYTDNNNIYNMCKDYKYSNIIIFFILIFLFYFIYKNLNHKKELEIEIKNKTKDLEEKINTEIKKNEEIQNLNRIVEESEEELKILNTNLSTRILEEVAKNAQKEQLLAQQSKMASMGEMLENIAHQWRQPLSVISTASSGIIMQKKFGLSSEEKEIETLNIITDSAQHLSKTIDDFRDFFKAHKEKKLFSIKEVYKRTLMLLESKFKNREIEVIENIEDIKIYGLDSELVQSIMNILNNARDILETKEKHQRRLIFIDIYKKENNAIIKIKDNGGGIPDDIIEKIFEPYFTTKHQSQGTGIGLYMTEEMIIKHMYGTISVENNEFEFESKSYKGACFTVTLPITKKDSNNG